MSSDLVKTCAVAFVLTLTCSAAAQTIADVSAIANDAANPVIVRLGAGTWRATPVDATHGGAFSAWHPWSGTNSGCGIPAGRCSQGWMWSAFVEVAGRPAVQAQRVVPGFGVPKWATAQDAFDHGSAALWIPLPATTDVALWIGDSFHGDNLGGVSVRFDQVAPARPLLTANLSSISTKYGGAQDLAIDGGMARAGHAYFVLGSSSGTTPPLALGLWDLPLHAPDPYLDFTLSAANGPMLVATVGRLDALGRAMASLVIPPRQLRPLSGLQLNHAVITFDAVNPSGISAPVSVDLVR